MKAFIITVLVLQTLTAIAPVFRLYKWNSYHEKLGVYCKKIHLDSMVRQSKWVDICTVGVTIFFYVFGFIVL